MDAINSALSGIQSATASFDQSAAKIAGGQSDTDLTTDVTNAIADKTAVKADAKVLQVADDMQKRLLDIKV